MSSEARESGELQANERSRLSFINHSTHFWSNFSPLRHLVVDIPQLCPLTCFAGAARNAAVTVEEDLKHFALTDQEMRLLNNPTPTIRVLFPLLYSLLLLSPSLYIRHILLFSWSLLSLNFFLFVLLLLSRLLCFGATHKSRGIVVANGHGISESLKGWVGLDQLAVDWSLQI